MVKSKVSRRPTEGTRKIYHEHLGTRLHDYFPISWRLVVKKCLPWLLILCFVTIAALWANGVPGTELLVGNRLLDEFDFELEILAAGLGGVLIVKMAYAALFRMRLKILLEGGHLKIIRGVVLQHKGIYPLSRISDVHSTQGWFDGLLGLHTVVISTVTSQSEKFARIEGLRGNDAEGLCAYLLRAIEDYQPLNRKRMSRGRGQRREEGEHVSNM